MSPIFLFCWERDRSMPSCPALHSALWNTFLFGEIWPEWDTCTVHVCTQVGCNSNFKNKADTSRGHQHCNWLLGHRLIHLWCVFICVCSEVHGHENPVFLGGSPQVKTRTVSQIMARQSSETGRHLLSEPGTPLSPPAHGDVFFPAEGRRHRRFSLTSGVTGTSDVRK